MSPHAVRPGPLDADPAPSAQSSRAGPGRLTTTLLRRAAGQLGVAPPARRIDQDVDRRADQSPRSARSESPAAAPAAPRSAASSPSSGTSSAQPLLGQRVRPRRVLEREHAVIPHRRGQRQRVVEVGVGLAREPDDHIGRERHVRQRVADARRPARDSSRAYSGAASRSSTRVEPDCTGRCRCRQTFGSRAIASRKRRRTCRGCGLANRIRSMPVDLVNRFEQAGEVARRDRPARRSG